MIDHRPQLRDSLFVVLGFVVVLSFVALLFGLGVLR